MNITPCVYSQFPVVVKEFDEIYHLGCNECFGFVAPLQYFCVLK